MNKNFNSQLGSISPIVTTSNASGYTSSQNDSYQTINPDDTPTGSGGGGKSDNSGVNLDQNNDWTIVTDKDGNTQVLEGTPYENGIDPSDYNSETPIDTTGNNPLGGSDSSYSLDANSLQSSIDSILAALLNGDDIQSAGESIAALLGNLQKYFQTYLKGVNEGEATSLATSAYSMISSYLTSILELMYNRQNWLLECDYNSPVNVMARYMEAGINPAFYYGSINNATGGSIASSNMKSTDMQYQDQSSLSSGAQRLVAGLGVAENLTNSALNVATTPSTIKDLLSSAKYSAELATTERDMRPSNLQLAKLNQAFVLSNTEFNNQQSKRLEEMTPQEVATLRSQQYLNYNTGMVAWQNSRIAYESLGMQYLLGLMNNQTQRYVADQILIGTKIQASATRYSADKNFQGILEGNDSRARIEFLKSNMHTTEVEEWQQYSDTAGGSIGTSVSAGTSSILDLAVAKGQASLNADGYYEYKGQKYKKQKVTKMNYDISRAAEMYQMYRKHIEDIQSGHNDLTPSEEAFLASQYADYFGHVTKNMQQTISTLFGNYTIDSVFDQSGSGGKTGSW